MTTESVLLQSTLRKPVSSRRQTRWSWPHYLALIGVPILILHAWTMIAWLADGPSQVTKFRDPNSFSWYAAHAVEGATIIASLLVIIRLVRGCRRAGEILTFEVMFCIASGSMWWADYGLNFFQPVFVMSSNFVNVTGPCGHMPFVVNPDCGRLPDPILFTLLLEAFVFLACAIVVTKIVARVRGRWPVLSGGKLLAIPLLVGIAFAVGEVGILAAGFWTYTGPGWMSIPLGHGIRWPVVFAVVETGSFFGLFCSVYVFRDDRGRTFVERGLDHHTPRVRKAITMMALYGCVQLLVWGPGTVPMIVASFYQDGPPKNLPKYLVNDVCDVPGVVGTRYGACPGTPEYRMPGRHSLPGRSP